MNKYFVIHSEDPWLLARLATELMMEGKIIDPMWAENFHPFKNDCKWLMIGDITPVEQISFHCHEGVGIPTRLTLTASSYNKVIKEIIQS